MADESLSDDQRFLKRLHLLSLESGKSSVHSHGNYYLTPPAPASNQANSDGAPPSRPIVAQEDSMSIDDTPNRVYIHDIDAELDDIQPREHDERLIFLPDIEKHFSRIPQQVLTGRRNSLDNHEAQQLVLYDVPKSLTKDEGHDSVRRAILEARQRARQKAVEAARYEDMVRKYGQSQEVHEVETAHGYTNGYEGDVKDHDPDAMDIG
ncbi:hypothetical protein B0A48_18311 [Cryoendolithus antarcticus]|uniref:Uncharacterized protein n=1 Tax=Cryoendolithus antarcticus TaxID=1507870 RepID=A0A1V8S8Y5_9PEZI|nr:hypothetical protein B0A48_18311 [Cryoendolithus antarcticus]